MAAFTSRRLAREHRTMAAMVRIYCVDHHPDAAAHPCPGCMGFLAYAAKRLEKCPYGDDKPTCARCPIHCYKRAQREQARAIMRHAGPRMAWRHPWLALRHMFDRFRRVEDPMDRRQRLRAAQFEDPARRS
ncbi:MAG: nitrous oxide-stimulated promoter family protein [Pseudomonadota bacterium]